mmetsp:Transcript_509/g.1048  ORF Transcript_509/g.1048 Transcript_509/m.1048 type:complete len:530 (-) Transcript_509:372-1961(-)
MKRAREGKEEECAHPVVFGALCTSCGAKVSAKRGHVELAPSIFNEGYSVQVSAEKAKIEAEKAQANKYKYNRLHLVLDLDHTILHCEVTHPQDALFIQYFPDLVTPQWKGVPKPFAQSTVNPDVYCFQLPNDPSRLYLLRLRPGARRFLQEYIDRFEIHVYTAAMAVYADVVVQIIDSQGVLIGKNTVAKEIFIDEHNAVMKNKELGRVFPLDSSLAVAVDDLPLQWTERESVIAIAPYSMQSTTSYRDAEARNVADGGLQGVIDVLAALHKDFNSLPAVAKVDWTVAAALAKLRAKVLDGMKVAVLVKDKKDASALRALIENLGGTYVDEPESAEWCICNEGSDVYRGLKNGVTPEWLLSTSLYWKMRDPRLYLLEYGVKRKALDRIVSRVQQVLHAPHSALQKLGDTKEARRVDVRGSGSDAAVSTALPSTSSSTLPQDRATPASTSPPTASSMRGKSVFHTSPIGSAVAASTSAVYPIRAQRSLSTADDEYSLLSSDELSDDSSMSDDEDGSDAERWERAKNEMGF